MALTSSRACVLLTVIGVLSFGAPVFAQNSAPTEIPASAQAGNSAAKQSEPAQQSSPHPVNNLLQAAQRLRDATHDLVRSPASQRRNALISGIDKIILQVQSAIDALPAKMLVAEASESSRKKAEAAMARAADRLHSAAAELSGAGSQKKAKVVKKIQNALAEIRKERSKLGSANAQQ